MPSTPVQSPIASTAHAQFPDRVAEPGFESLPGTWESAIRAWRDILGEDGVTTDSQAVEEHGRNMIGSNVRGTTILQPRFERQVASIVRIANEFKTPLYPISTGRNWGYGAASPVTPGCAVVDLSGLRQIRVIDRELGVVALQPGVTQGMLWQFLEAEELDFMVPVHGGGPSCSILGNALERGYGLTPTTDHFSALTSLTAVLPDGSTYRSPLHAMGAPLIGSLHRWGVGPYVEGLFSQGNFGIVTEATFTLARRPEHVGAFFVRLANENQFGEFVDSMRTILSSLGATVSGINLMNSRRVLSMSHSYPVDRVAPYEIMSESLCKEMAKAAGITAWTAAGVVHCPAAMQSAVRREISRLIPASLPRPIHFNRRRLGWARTAGRLIPGGLRSIHKQLDSIESLLDLADGIPRRVALPLAYWLQGRSPSVTRDINPAKDGCGLIWYSPLVPMKSANVNEYVKMVTRVCTDHGIEPLITLTSLSDRLFDSTVPVLYCPEQPGATEMAHECFNALLQQGHAMGCLPYRFGTQTMTRLKQFDDGSHKHFVHQLKKAIDPGNLIAPGRYAGVSGMNAQTLSSVSEFSRPTAQPFT